MHYQTELTFIVGYPERRRPFERAIVAAACKAAGGCTINTGRGFWCEDADQFKSIFETIPANEHAFELRVTVEEPDAERVYADVAHAIADAVERFQIAADWIHCQSQRVQRRHFSVQEMLAKRQAAA